MFMNTNTDYIYTYVHKNIAMTSVSMLTYSDISYKYTTVVKILSRQYFNYISGTISHKTGVNGVLRITLEILLSVGSNSQENFSLIPKGKHIMLLLIYSII